MLARQAVRLCTRHRAASFNDRGMPWSPPSADRWSLGAREKGFDDVEGDDDPPPEPYARNVAAFDVFVERRSPDADNSRGFFDGHRPSLR